MQRAVLLRTREKLEALQRTVAQLEAQLGARAAADVRTAPLSRRHETWRSCTAVRARACVRPRSASRCTWPAACRAMSIVGLPEAAVREAKDRVRAAIQCAQFEFPGAAHHRQPRAGRPAQGRRPLRPADRARHPRRQRPDAAATRCSEYEFLGELGLTGELRAVDGVLPAALAAAQAGRKLIVPRGQRRRGGAGARGRGQHRAHAAGSVRARSTGRKHAAARAMRAADAPRRAVPTWPTCAARRRRGARWKSPRPAATTCCWSARPAAARPCWPRACPACCRKPARPRRWKPPRSPRSAAAAWIRRAGASGRIARRTTPPARWRWSAAAREPRPGEISLAHHGVLFLDELPEWDRRALEVLREPLESGVVTISRAARQSEFPARFQLVAAMNPCPCGWAGDPSRPLPLHADAHPALPRRAFPGRCWTASTCTSTCRGCRRRNCAPDAPAGETSAHGARRGSTPRAPSSMHAPASPTRSSARPKPWRTAAWRRTTRPCWNARSTRLQLSRALDAPHPARGAHHRRPRRQRAHRHRAPDRGDGLSARWIAAWRTGSLTPVHQPGQL